MSTQARLSWRRIDRRSLVAAGVLAPWLLVLTSRQVPLYHGAGGGAPGPELVPLPVAVGLLAAAAVLRLLRPAVLTHVLLIAVGVGAIALAAASLGSPFANATVDYCGDFCRTAIMGRLAAFFGWPILTAALLVLAVRIEGRGTSADIQERAAWSAAWIAPTLALGFAAAVAWWNIVLSR